MQQLSDFDGKILEGMVGTGRLLVPMLEAGLNIEGIDSSPDMLAACKKNCISRGLNPTLYQGEIENLDIPSKFSAIIVTLGSFMLLGNRASALAALAAFARHLDTDGRIFIDLALPIDSFKVEGVVRQYEPIQCPDSSVIMMQTSSKVDWIDQVEHTFIRYEKWRDGKLIDTELQHLQLHWFGIEEFMLCLQRCGFTDITLCANYQSGIKPSSYRDQLCFSAALA
ncbi:MAG: class I SAM-dependent methyltransferase [Cyanobacteria bacterium P01_A01_bin.135]